MEKQYSILQLLSLICAFTLLFCVANSVQAQTGYVKFESNADSFKVVVDYNYLEIYTVSSGDSIEIKQGLHNLRLSTPFTQDRFIRINVMPESTKLVYYTVEELPISIDNLENNVSAAQYYGATLILLTDEDTDIFYEDSYVGTGYAMINALNGNRLIRYENKYGYKKNVNYRIKTSRVTAASQFLKPTKKVTQSAAIFPGASQLLKRQRVKASIFFTGTAGGALIAIINNVKLNSAIEEYDNTYFFYKNATDEAYASLLGDELKNLADNSKKYERNRNIALGTTLAFYLYNIYDGLTSIPKGGFKDDKGLDFYFSDSDLTGGGMSSTATIKYNF